MDWIEDGIVLAAQNGVDHRARIQPLTDAAVVPVLVYSNARRTGPGEVTVTPTGRGIVVPDNDFGRTAAAHLASPQPFTQPFAKEQQ